MSDAWGIWEIHPDLVDGRYLDIACFLQCALLRILISAFIDFVKIKTQARKLLFSKCGVTYRKSNYQALGIAILNSYDNSRKQPTVFHGIWITKVAFHDNWKTKAVWRFSGSFWSPPPSTAYIMWQLQKLVLFTISIKCMYIFCTYDMYVYPRSQNYLYIYACQGLSSTIFSAKLLMKVHGSHK